MVTTIRPHRSFSSDAVVKETDGHIVLVELLDQLDHVAGVPVPTGRVSEPGSRRHFPPSAAAC